MVNNNIVIEGARIWARNFRGKEGKFNPPGKRNFCVYIDFDPAKQLQQDGWNIRWLDPMDDQEDPQASLRVAVSYDNIPPKIVLVTSKNKTVLDVESIEQLDTAEIANIDLIIRPYNWVVNGKEGVKAYLKTMYVTLNEDEFEHKYEDIPEGKNSDTVKIDFDD